MSVVNSRDKERVLWHQEQLHDMMAMKRMMAPEADEFTYIMAHARTHTYTHTHNERDRERLTEVPGGFSDGGVNRGVTVT